VARETRSIVWLIADGTLDAELAAELWLLIEARVPLIVAAGARGTGASTLLAALLDFLPAATRVVELAGQTETFAWFPQASELGWPGKPEEGPAVQPVRPDTTVLLAAELSEHLPESTWGAAARVAVRAASIGYGLATTMYADTLEGIFATLQAPPVGLSEDECSHLGVVLIMRRVDEDRRRIVAAHYVRPIARDVHGHVQRLGPAVLATWDPLSDRQEHFGWGVTPELARRVGCRAGDYEIELDRRRAYLDGLVAADAMEPEPARDAIRAYEPAPAIDARASRT
jgi:hypothetical protein